MPERARDEVRVEVEEDDGALTIVERRAPWSEDLGPEWSRRPVARLRYAQSRAQWTLYWSDRNQQFREYDRVGPTAHVDDLLAEIEQDPTGIFWG